MTAPDFNNMTAAQVRDFIEGQPAAEPEAEQPRDEQGRFTRTENSVPTVDETVETQTQEPEVAAAPEDDAEQYFHREEIDNGAGGKEVFTGIGATPEEAVQDCLRQVVEAKGHATRKIREMSQATTPAPVVPPAEDDIDEGELLVKLQSQPKTAIRELVQRELQKEREARDRAEQERKTHEQQADKASREFVAAMPDFYACEANGTKMIKWLEINQKPATVESLREAYADLSSSGLLMSRPDTTPATQPARSSGFSARRATPAPAKTPAQVKEDMSKLTKEQLLELAGGYQNPY
jgi:hypothetical protein